MSGRTILVATKSDDDASDIRLEMAKEWLDDRYPLVVVSAQTGAGLDDLRKAVFVSLRVMRIQTKQPGKPVDPSGPPFTCTIFSLRMNTVIG